MRVRTLGTWAPDYYLATIDCQLPILLASWVWVSPAEAVLSSCQEEYSLLRTRALEVASWTG